MARTQARKRVVHWSTASSISDCSNLATHAADAVAAHQCHERDSDGRHIYVTRKINE